MQRVKLGQVCEVVSGSTPKTGNESYWDGDIDWITPAELSDDTYIVSESIRKITAEGVSKTGLKPFPQGTVILSSRAPIGKVAIAGKTMYCNQGFKNLICSDRIDNAYLYWFLKGSTEYLNSLGRGATFKEISKTIVENIEINLPPIDGQKHNAKILKQCKDIVNLRKWQLTVLNDLIKSRFVEMFGNPEFNDKNWPIITMDKVCTIGSSKRIYQNEQCREGVPFLRISDLVYRMDSGVLKTDLYIPLERYDVLKKQGLVPKSGDVLVTSRGTLGRCYVIGRDDKFYFQDGMISRLSEFNEKITSLYLSNLFTMPGFRKQIDHMQAGSTVPYLSIAMIKKLRVMLPDLKLQNEFADFINEIDKSKAVI